MRQRKLPPIPEETQEEERGTGINEFWSVVGTLNSVTRFSTLGFFGN
jgi:hypothetical protein